jgi:hypothetical protein
LVNIAAISAVGNKATALAKGGAMAQRLVSTAIPYFSSAAALKREGFNELITNNPDMDHGLAYSMANIHGYTAAIYDTAGFMFVAGKMPFFDKAIKTVGSPKWLNKLVNKGGGVSRFTKATLVTGGVEAFTEVMQMVNLDMIQEIGSALRDDIPDIQFWDKFVERFGEFDEMFWAMLPISLIAGGKAGLMKPSVVENIVRDETKMRSIGMDELDVNDILEAQSVGEAVTLLQDSFDVDKAGDALQSKMEDGTAAESMVDPQTRREVETANDELNSDSEKPMVVKMDDGRGNTIGYAVQVPGMSKAEQYDDIVQAGRRVQQWYEDNGVSEDVAKKADARDGKRVSDLTKQKETLEKEVADLKAKRDKPDPEKPSRDFEAEIKDRDAKIAQLEKDIEKEKARTPEKKEEPESQKPPEERSNTTTEETEDSEGKPARRTIPKPDMAQDKHEPVNTQKLGISHAMTNAVLKDLGLENEHVKVRSHWADLIETVISEDPKLENVRGRVLELIKDPSVIQKKDQAKILLYYRQVLQKIELLQKQINEAEASGDAVTADQLSVDLKATNSLLQDALKALDMLGSNAGFILGMRRILIDKATMNISAIRRKAKIANGGRDLDPKAQEELDALTKEYNKILEELDSLTRENQGLKEENAKAKAEQAFKEGKSKSKDGPSKTTAEKRRDRAANRLRKRGVCVG